MKKDRQGNPLSGYAKEDLWINAWTPVLFLLLPLLFAFLLHSVLDVTPLYNLLYDARVESWHHDGTEAANPDENWQSGWDGKYYHVHAGQKSYGVHKYAVKVAGRKEVHKEAHWKDYSYDNGFGRNKDVYLPTPEGRLFWMYYAAGMIYLLNTPLGIQDYVRRRRRAFEKAEVDFTNSQKLAKGRLGTRNIFSDDQGFAEIPIEGDWLLVRSHIDTVKDRYSGESIPNLEQLSAVLWFTDGKRTIRVNVLDDRRIRNTVADAVEKWLKVISPSTHVGAVLSNFRNTRDRIRPMTVLNEILADEARNPFEKRRPVKLRGAFKADDLLLATGLSIDDGAGGQLDQIVFPTGFLLGVRNDVRQVTGVELPVPWFVGGKAHSQIAA